MTRSISLLSLAAMAVSLAACAPEPEESFAEGRAAFAEHDFARARVALLAGLSEMPNDTEMRTLLARTQIALGDGNNAFATLDALPAELKMRPDNAVLIGEAQVLRGNFAEAREAVAPVMTAAADRVRALALLGEGRIDEAAEAFATGAGREQPDARLLASYARFELARGNADAAARLAEAGREADGEAIEPLLATALVSRWQGRNARALAAYNAALQTHPANFEASLGKAQLLVAMEKFADAGPLVAALDEESPENPDIALLRAQLAANEADWSAVRDILQPYEQQMDRLPRMRLVYGEALIELDNHAQAVSLLRPLLRGNPGSRELRELLARAQFGAGDADQAFATIEPLAMRPDAQPTELEIAARVAQATGDPRASEFQRRSRQITPQWVGGELAKADRALRNRQWETASASYSAILDRSDARNAMVLNNLAYAQSQLGEKKRALELALEAAELEPGNAAILDTAGTLLVETGSRDRGVRMLERAVALDPDNAGIAGRLARAKKS